MNLKEFKKKLGLFIDNYNQFGKVEDENIDAMIPEHMKMIRDEILLRKNNTKKLLEEAQSKDSQNNDGMIPQPLDLKRRMLSV